MPASVSDNGTKTKNDLPLSMFGTRVDIQQSHKFIHFSPPNYHQAKFIKYFLPGCTTKNYTNH